MHLFMVAKGLFSSLNLIIYYELAHPNAIPICDRIIADWYDEQIRVAWHMKLRNVTGRGGVIL